MGVEMRRNQERWRNERFSTLFDAARQKKIKIKIKTLGKQKKQR